MLGNFVYSNPTKLYFGGDAIKNLSDELKNYGPRVLLTYGGGSIKRNGIYDDVMAALKATGKEVIELPSRHGATRTRGRNTTCVRKSLVARSFPWGRC